jgi:hypothetical protein
MKGLFSSNITRTGRQVRGCIAGLLLFGAGFAFAFCVWLGLALVVSGVFVLFEALRGGCALRPCGIKIRV